MGSVEVIRDYTKWVISQPRSTLTHNVLISLYSVMVKYSCSAAFAQDVADKGVVEVLLTELRKMEKKFRQEVLRMGGLRPKAHYNEIQLNEV